MQNQAIDWNQVEVDATKCSTATELDDLWKYMDGKCYGRSDCDRLDSIIGQCRKKLNQGTPELSNVST